MVHKEEEEAAAEAAAASAEGEGEVGGMEVEEACLEIREDILNSVSGAGRETLLR